MGVEYLCQREGSSDKLVALLLLPRLGAVTAMTELWEADRHRAYLAPGTGSPAGHRAVSAPGGKTRVSESSFPVAWKSSFLAFFTNVVLSWIFARLVWQRRQLKGHAENLGKEKKRSRQMDSHRPGDCEASPFSLLVLTLSPTATGSAQLNPAQAGMRSSRRHSKSKLWSLDGYLKLIS